MSKNKLYKIDEPSSVPTNISDYKKQNYLLQTIPLFSLGFDGIKLGNWADGNISLPYIIAGSVIEFNGILYESKNNIELTDECGTSPTDRYIVFYEDAECLKVKIANRNFPYYMSSKRGFYRYSEGNILEKYLRVSMKKESGAYRSKKYWDKDDVNRGGGEALKKYSLLYKTPGTFNFEYPLNAESVIFHIMAAGGGGGALNASNGTVAQSGGKSEIILNAITITSCAGGFGGGDSGFGSYVGIGGIASGVGRLFNGNDSNDRNGASPNGSTNAVGGYGGKGSDNHSTLSDGYGGGSGSCAIVEILRSELGSAKYITIIVGLGGAYSTNGFNHDVLATAGKNGSVYLEYYA